jgi:hypothetical protein
MKSLRTLKDWLRSRAHFLYGALTLLPGFPCNLLWRHTGGTISARYCYSVWMRHLVSINKLRSGVPKSIAELGPGDSVGIGLAALLSGAERYVALDVVKYADLSGSCELFEELVMLFKERAAIPNQEEFPDIKPLLNDYSFPASILTQEILADSLSESRLEMLRLGLRTGGDESCLSYAAPWFDANVMKSSSVDLIFSQAVMEHVDDIHQAYAFMYRWLTPNGLISHQVDFKSHRLTLRWDGVRALSNWQWRILRGKRPYLLNRVVCGGHLDAMLANGFRLLQLIRFERDPEVSRKNLAVEFCQISEPDRRTAGAYFIAQKEPSISQMNATQRH